MEDVLVFHTRHTTVDLTVVDMFLSQVKIKETFREKIQIIDCKNWNFWVLSRNSGCHKSEPV